MLAPRLRQHLAGITSSIVLSVGLIAATPVIGQNAFPERPIKLIVPFAPGGVTDVAARLISAEAAKTLGTSIVIENRAGAGGNIGIQAATVARPDGYTLVLGGLPTITAILTSKNVGYDLFKDLAPVSGAMTFDSVLISSKRAGVASVEALKHKIASGERVTYGTAGVNTPSHFMSAWFAHIAGGTAEPAHYRGGSAFVTDVLSGELTFAAATLPVVRTLRNDLTVLAALSKTRLPQMPDVPTIAEAGMPAYLGVDWRVWHAIYVPANTPRAIINRLNAAYNSALRKPELEAALSPHAMYPMIVDTPDQLTALQRQQFDTWKVILSKIGVVPD